MAKATKILTPYEEECLVNLIYKEIQLVLQRHAREAWTDRDKYIAALHNIVVALDIKRST